MQSFRYAQLPARIVFGAGAARTQLAAEVERLGATRVLVLASTRDEQRVAAITAPLGDRVAGSFTAVREHVPLPTAEAARAAAKEVDADALLAIGGGLDRRGREGRRADRPPARRRRADDLLRLRGHPGVGTDRERPEDDRHGPCGAPPRRRLRPGADRHRCPPTSPPPAASTPWRTPWRRCGRPGATR